MKISNLLWGIVLIVLGIIFGLNALEITNINVFFDGWWTLFIIVPCVIDLFKDKNKTGNIIGILVGICLLLACQNIISFGLIFKLMIPVTLVIVGVSILFKDTINSKVKKKIKELNTGNKKEHCATFGGIDLDFSNETFESCSLSAVFGGVKCNLKDAVIKNDVVINISSIFGGVDLIVPNDVTVKISSTPICGGVSDERKNKDINSKNTIYVNAICMFGGVDIK